MNRARPIIIVALLVGAAVLAWYLLSGGKRERSEKIVQPLEPLTQILWPFAEADAEIPVHPEVVPGNDQHAFLLAQPRHQRC